MIAINPVKVNTTPIVFGHKNNNIDLNTKRYYDNNVPNVAALAIQSEGARTSFEKDWNATCEADAVQSNVFLSPVYKIQKAIKLLQAKKAQAQANMPHLEYVI